MATLIIEATRVVVNYQIVQDYPILVANLLPTRWTPLITGVYKANVECAVFRDQSTASMNVLLWDDKR